MKSLRGLAAKGTSGGFGGANTKVLAIAGAGLLALLAVGYLGLIGPQRSRAAKLDTEIVAIQQQIDAARAASLARPPAPTRIDRLFRLTKAMPDRTDMPGMLLELSRLASETGIEFDSITPTAPMAAGGTLQTVPVQLAFRGNFYELSDFLFRLRTLVAKSETGLDVSGRLYSVDGVDFAEGATSSQLSARVTAKAFIYGTGAGSTTAAAPPPAATPPATGTTPTAATPARGDGLMATATIGRTSAAGAKAARQKKIVIVGAVLLGIVMVIQVPRTMKMMGGSESAAPAAVPAPVAPAPGTPVTGTPVVPAAPEVAAGKLISFERFKAKDPFIPQVSAGGETQAPTATGSAATQPAAESTTGGTATGTTATSSSPATATFSTTSSGKQAAAGGTKATISVNGREYTVAESKTFPAADPVFRLVAIHDGHVELAIADGSLKNGGKTVELEAGTPLTLLNTADNKRYRLVLISPSG